MAKQGTHPTYRAGGCVADGWAQKKENIVEDDLSLFLEIPLHTLLGQSSPHTYYCRPKQGKHVWGTFDNIFFLQDNP